MKVLDRFLKYIQVETTSREESQACPSTPGQKVLGQMLADELRSMGIQDARMDDHGCVYGTIPPMYFAMMIPSSCRKGGGLCIKIQ